MPGDGAHGGPDNGAHHFLVPALGDVEETGGELHEDLGSWSDSHTTQMSGLEYN